MSERGTFVTIHGIDGTGKTTTTQNTTDVLRRAGVTAVNYDEYETTLDNPFAAAKKRVLAETSPAAQFAFYLGSTLYHSNQIEELLRRGLTVVKTRYVDDVIAHHAHLGVPNAEGIARSFPILQPDLRVVLLLSEEERRRRIGVRGEVDEKDKEVKRNGSRLDFFEMYLLQVASEQRPHESLVLNTIAEPLVIAERIVAETLYVRSRNRI